MTEKEGTFKLYESSGGSSPILKYPMKMPQWDQIISFSWDFKKNEIKSAKSQHL